MKNFCFCCELCYNIVTEQECSVTCEYGNRYNMVSGLFPSPFSEIERSLDMVVGSMMYFGNGFTLECSGHDVYYVHLDFHNYEEIFEFSTLTEAVAYIQGYKDGYDGKQKSAVSK